MSHSHPGDHLQISLKFNGLFANMSLAAMQNFSQIFQVFFELWLFECS